MNNKINQGHLLGIEDPAAIESFGWTLGYAQNIGARTQQQDCLGAATGSFQGKPVLLAVLADGMGGMKNSAEFSRIAVNFHVNHLQRILTSAAPFRMFFLSLRFKPTMKRIKFMKRSSPAARR